MLRNAFRIASLACLAAASCVATPPTPPTVASAPSAQPPARPLPSASAPAPNPALAAPAQPALSPAASSYADAARRIREASLANDGAFQKLSYLTDQIGARLSGSVALEHALVWAKDTLIADGHERVALEPVRVPHWVRGAQSATLLTPVARELSVLTLGGSVATPPGGLTAELTGGQFVRGARSAQSRSEGENRALRSSHVAQGQCRARVRRSDRLPHHGRGPRGPLGRLGRTGALAHDAQPGRTAHRFAAPTRGQSQKYPGSLDLGRDAELLHRLSSRGVVPQVHLTLRPQTLPDADSANVIGELRGRELPDEIVLIGAHLDSWDVGQGAQDDGAGVVTVMQALTTLRSLGLIPRRTVRAVLFTNEENGRRGAAQYAKAHSSELAQHVAAFEMDAGSGSPLGFMTEGEQPYLAEAREYSALLSPIGANTMIAGYSGEDVQALKASGVPLFGVLLDLEHYFDVHHSAADTLDKVDPEHLQKAVAALATFAFVVADRPGAWRALPIASAPP